MSAGRGSQPDREPSGTPPASPAAPAQSGPPSPAVTHVPTGPPTAPPIDDHCRRLPAEPLRPYVAWYVGYRQRGVAPAVHRGLPSPFLTLIVTLDEPLCMLAHPDPGQRPGEFTTLLGGLHSTPALITHDGAQSGIQVALRPLGTRVLLGLPAGELADIDVPAESVLGSAVAELRARILDAPGWDDRFAILDGILFRLVARRPGAAPEPPNVAPEVSYAWRQLLRAGGDLRVDDLADRTGWSGRHLTSRFRTEVGLTPKAAARVIRFSRARALLARHATATPPAPPGARPGAPPGARPGAPPSARPGAPPSAPEGAPQGAPPGSAARVRLADLAVECGYFDQAHLAREFRALAGLPPSQWLAEEFRNVQAGAWLSEAAWIDQAW